MTVPGWYIFMGGESGGHWKNRKKSDGEKSSGGRETAKEYLTLRTKYEVKVR